LERSSKLRDADARRFRVHIGCTVVLYDRCACLRSFDWLPLLPRIVSLIAAVPITQLQRVCKRQRASAPAGIYLRTGGSSAVRSRLIRYPDRVNVDPFDTCHMLVEKMYLVGGFASFSSRHPARCISGGQSNRMNTLYSHQPLCN